MGETDVATKKKSSKTRKRRPADLNRLAASIVTDATSEDETKDQGEADSQGPQKDSAAVELGRKGGLKGGIARAKKLTERQRSEIARIAAEARWKKQ